MHLFVVVSLLKATQQANQLVSRVHIAFFPTENIILIIHYALIMHCDALHILRLAVSITLHAARCDRVFKFS